jgi:hypothetical protein
VPLAPHDRVKGMAVAPTSTRPPRGRFAAPDALAPVVVISLALLASLAAVTRAQVADTTLWQPDNIVRGITIGSGRAFVWGNFNSFRGAPRARLASIDLATGRVTDWNPAPDDLVNAVAVDGDTVYVGGTFTRIGGFDCPYFASFHISTGEPVSLTGASYPILGLAARGGSTFAAMNNGTFAFIACWNAVGPAWAQVQPYYGNPILLSGSRLYVTGTGVQAGLGVRALRTDTGAPLSWTVSTNNIVRAIAVEGNTVYLGGNFNQVGSEMRNKLAAVDATSGAVTAWNPGAGGTVLDLKVADGLVYVAGAFTSIDGATRSNLAALGQADGVASDWAPDPGSTVNAIAMDGSTVYAGGFFGSICGQDVAFLARMEDSQTGTLIASFDAEIEAAGVRLRWAFQAVVGHVTVERATSATGPWQPLALEQSQSAGGTEALDPGVTPGTDYWYRLRAQLAGGGEALFGPVEAHVPAAISSTGIVRLWPNPSGGPLHVDYTLERGGFARLTVVDVAGRQVSSLFEGRVPAGRYSASWTRDRALTPGMYFVRLDSGTRSCHRAFVVTR